MFLLNAEIKPALKHEQARQFGSPRHTALGTHRGPQSCPGGDANTRLGAAATVP